MAIITNLSSYRGEDVEVTVRVEDDDEAAVDVTGWTVYLAFRDPDTGINPFAEKLMAVLDGPGGTLRVTVPRADLLLMTAIAYDFEIYRTDAGANSVLSAGPWVVQGRAV